VSGVSIELVDPESGDAVACLAAFGAELAERFPAGFDPARSAPADPELFRPPSGAFLVGRRGGVPIACGALKHDGSGIGEIKRMWVSRDSRGLGLGRQMLAALEQEARDRGLRALRLETNDALSEAVRLYGSAGYEPIDRFGDDPYAEHWFAKTL
jgi:GNAT superfamily N-acetyltransferase